MNDLSRRLVGFFFGIVSGLSFGLVSQYINTLFLPGLPLLGPAVGHALAVALITLAAGLLGLLAAWPDDAIPGVIISVLVGTLALSILAVWDTVPGSDRAFSTLVILFITFLPRTFLLLPFAGLVRWSLGIWSGELQNPNFSSRKLGLSLSLIVILAVAAGAFSLHSSSGRAALTTTQALVQAGMQLSGGGSPESLPAALRPVNGFLGGARGAYTLELIDDPDRLPIQRAITSYDEEIYGVLVRFANGYRFGCVFTPAAPPACGTY